MYKVFIDNTPLFIVEDHGEILPNAVYIHSENILAIQQAIFAFSKKVKLACPVYIVTKTPESTFAKLFSGFDFIEAAGGIVQREDRYLFIKRNGFWDIPKGKLDLGETPEVGAVREIEEECGIVGPKIEQLITATYHTYKLTGKPKIKKTYWYALSYDGPKEIMGQLEEGITKVKWFKKSEFDKIRAKTFNSILDVIERYDAQLKKETLL
ncbi:MAG: NUDIX domain-containing protein [Crocinitomicaceae bacterium]